MRLQWVPCESMCGRGSGQCTLTSKLLKWHQYRVSETHVMLTNCHHWVCLWLPHRVSLPTEVYQLGHVKTTIFLKSPKLLLFIDYRQSVLKMLQDPLQPGLSYVTILMVTGDSSLDWLCQMEMFCPSITPLCECSGPFFSTGTLLRDPQDPRLCHFLRKWHLLRTSTRPRESIKTCVGAQAVVSYTLNSKLVTLSSDRGQGRVTDKPYPDFKSKVMPGFRH